MRRRSTMSRTSSRSSSRARSATRFGSQTSTWDRIRPGSLGDLPADRLHRPRLHVLVRQRRLSVRPRQDAFDQRAGLVVPRLADGEHGVHVDMRVDEWRREEPAAGVELGPAVAGDRTGRADSRDRVAIDAKVIEGVATGRRRMDPGVADDQTCRCHAGSSMGRRPIWAGRDRRRGSRAECEGRPTGTSSAAGPPGDSAGLDPFDSEVVDGVAR